MTRRLRASTAPFWTVLWTALLLSGSLSASAALIGPELQARLRTAGAEEKIPVVLSVGPKADLSVFSQQRSSARGVIRALQAAARTSQPPVVSFLRSRGIESTTFWIDNLIACNATPALLDELAGLASIERIDLDVPIYLVDGTARTQSPETTYWNMLRIRAPEVWSVYGLNGHNVVVGSMDTGFDPDHPALAGKWRGGTNSWLDVINGLPDPYDDHGHGTHTIGTMVGGDGPGPFIEDIGIAYGARFISAKILNRNNAFGSVTIALTGAQWMLDPDGNPDTDDFPDVINNSWAFGDPTYSGFYAATVAWRAAGIIPVFAIANEGPNPETTRPPGNYDTVIGVGATDSQDLVWVSSSRGPSPAGSIFPPDRRKPDLSAPGVAVRSSIPGGGYAEWFGTSMASPHVAGTVAILRQLNPHLSFDEVRSMLIQGAKDQGADGYDYDYGYGRLDAFDALASLAAGVGESAERGARIVAAPNPFRDRLLLRASPSEQSSTGVFPSASIFDVTGRMVRSVPLDVRTGEGSWDGLGTDGERAAAGLYYIRLDSERAAEARPILLVR